MAVSGTHTGAGRPIVAISSCLLGERVRYDGEHKRDAYITETLSRFVEWRPVCPEVAIGMGVPRPPIRLVGDEACPSALGVEDPDLDVTDALIAYAREMIRELHDISGYIFKSKSPSCGLSDAGLFDAAGLARGFTTGLYAQAIRKSLPHVPVIDEQMLQDGRAQRRFLEQVRVCWRQQNAGNP